MKLNGTHHQSPRVHDRLMKSTSPRLDDHLSLFSFYLKLVSISVQNELGRIHIWKNIFLFFLMYIWACFFLSFLSIFINSTILTTCLQKLPAVTLPSSQTIKFLVTKKITLPGRRLLYFSDVVCPPLKKCLCDFFFWLIEEQVWFCCGIWSWMYQIMYVLSLLLLDLEALDLDLV